MKKIKILIAHPGKQHSIQFAEAVNISKFDMTYITTVYDSKKSILMRLVKLFSSSKNKQRANARKSNILKDGQVKTFYSFIGLIRIFLAHYDKSLVFFHKATVFLSKLFGEKVAEYAIDNNVDVVVSYDTFSGDLFKKLSKNNQKIIKLMDASAANLAYQKQIFEKDMELTPEYADKLLSEVSYTMEDKRNKLYIDEAKDADYIIVASEFSKRSYVSVGVSPDKIFVCPYAIDIAKFEYKKVRNRKNKEIVFTFLGGTKQSKGLSYMLDAFQKLPRGKARLNIVGFDNLSLDLKNKYTNEIHYLGLKLHSEIPEILQNSDVVLFPSLSDGFGFAAAEGMATGCPVIASDNSGICDLITDEVNGFIVKTQSTDELYNKMMWFIDNQDKIFDMGLAARKSIESLTKEKYNDNINYILSKIIKETMGEE